MPLRMSSKPSGRWKSAAAFGAVVVVAGGVAGWLAVRPRAPLAVAVEQISEGQTEAGCAALTEHLGAAEKPPGFEEAKATCVDRLIETALAVEDPTRRELELLAIAAPGRLLGPSATQLVRIEDETAKLPGALENGSGRIRPVSYEVHGPISTQPVRSTFRALATQLRACHASAALAEPEPDKAVEMQGTYTVRLRVEQDGKVSGVTAVDGKSSTHEPTHKVHNEVLTSCVRDALTGRELAPADEASMVLVEMRIRPMKAG